MCMKETVMLVGSRMDWEQTDLRTLSFEEEREAKIARAFDG